MKSDHALFADKTAKELQAIKEQLDALHFEKIKIADRVLVLNVDCYIGRSTQAEIEYAQSIGKPITYWHGAMCQVVADELDLRRPSRREILIERRDRIIKAIETNTPTSQVIEMLERLIP
jgi:hypothetical protein